MEAQHLQQDNDGFEKLIRSSSRVNLIHCRTARWLTSAKTSTSKYIQFKKLPKRFKHKSLCNQLPTQYRPSNYQFLPNTKQAKPHYFKDDCVSSHLLMQG